MRSESRVAGAASRSFGFTLVELAVVCSMVAILTAMVIPVARYTL